MDTPYAVAVRNDKELHITPLRSRIKHPITEDFSEEIIDPEKDVKPKLEELQMGGGIFQMRPDFSHLNVQESSGAAPVEVASGSDDFQKVKVTLQSRKQQRLKSTQMKSFAYQQELQQKESWVPYEFFHFDTSFEPSNKLNQLYFLSDSDLETPVVLTKQQYLASIVGNAAAPKQLSETYGVCSKGLRDTLPLEEQVSALLKSAAILDFEGVKRQLSVVPEEDAQLIRVLESVAVCIRGAWIIRSKFVAEIRADKKKLNVRDYLLLQLYKEDYVSKKELADACDFRNPGELLEIFSKICVMDRSIPDRVVWSLSKSDPLFFIQFPQVKDRFDKFWAEEERRLTLIYQGNAVSPIQQFFAEVFGTHGVLNFSFLKTLLDRKIKAGEYTMLSDISDKQFLEELARVADSYKSAYYMRDHPDPTMNRYRKVILGCYIKGEKTGIRKKDILAAAQAELRAPIPQEAHNAILKELAYPKGGSWIFKSGTGKDG